MHNLMSVQCIHRAKIHMIKVHGNERKIELMESWPKDKYFPSEPWDTLVDNNHITCNIHNK